MGAAYKIPNRYWDRAYFPTIFLRNVIAEINFGNSPEEFFPIVQVKEAEKIVAE